jgi:hypothetical protein
VLKIRSIIVAFLILISFNLLAQDKEEMMQNIFSICEGMWQNIETTGPHIDGSTMIDTISGESFNWAITYYHVNDSSKIKEFENYSESNKYKRQWFILSFKPIICFESGVYDSIPYNYYYFFEDQKLIGVSNDTLITKEFIYSKEMEILQELDTLD